MLWYYLPTALGIANPSVWLRRFAVRVDGSVWIVPEIRVPKIMPWVDDVNNTGKARASVVRYDLDEEEKIRQTAQITLEAEAARIIASLDASLKTAKEKHEAAARQSSAEER